MTTIPTDRMFSTGEVVTTASERKTKPFPKVDLTTERRTTNTIRRVRQWLLDEARVELEHQGSARRHLVQCGVIDRKVSDLTTADVECFQLILFFRRRWVL